MRHACDGRASLQAEAEKDERAPMLMKERREETNAGGGGG